MATSHNHDDEQQQQRQRQYEIDQITARYVAEDRAGHAPKIAAYIQRHPTYARELLEFTLAYNTLDFDASEPDAVPAAVLSPAAQRALARIQEQSAATSPAPTPALEGLAQQGMRVGFTPASLAAAVGLNTTLLAKLEAHAIAAATIPRLLIERLAQTLGVTADAVAAFLGTAPAAQAGAFYYAEQAPTQRQEPFLDAVRASDLAPDAKQQWEAAVQGEAESAP